MSSNVRLRNSPGPAAVNQAPRSPSEPEHAGIKSIPELCAELDHPDVEKRVRAAQALAEIGDERTIGPLTDALADLSEARYAGVRRRRVIARATLGILLGTGVAGFTFAYPTIDVTHLGRYAVLCCLTFNQPFSSSMLLALVITTFALLLRRGNTDGKRMATIAAFADALGEIAARHPSPDLRAALEDLTASRAAAGRASAEWLPTIDRAIERIEEATAALQQLPLPSEQAGIPLPELPLPAAGIADVTATRPRPSGPRDDP